MNIEVLVSTMNKTNKEELLKKMNIFENAIIINQVTKSKIDTLLNDTSKNQKIISIREKGLSKSRNKAIINSNSEICIIADDDLTYLKNYKKVILDAYKKYEDADIIAFYVNSKKEDRPTTKQKEGKVGYLRSMKISSFQITFRRKSILENSIYFDEKFGAGSDKYTMGEENIFLFDCLRKKLKIYYVDETIATVYHHDSTWYEGFNKLFFISKGAAFYRMSKVFSNIFIFQFAIRKYRLYKNDISLITSLIYMFKGKKEMMRSNAKK